MATDFDALAAKWRRDSLSWVADNFPTIVLTKQQRGLFKRLDLLIHSKLKRHQGHKLTEVEEKYSRKVGISIMAGQGVGKDFCAALVMLYFMACFPHARGVATGVTGKHLRNILWAEIAKIMRMSKKINPKDDRSPTIMEELFEWQTERLSFKGVKKVGSEWFAECVTVNKNASEEEQAGTLYGRHADYMLILADEAASIPDPVFRPLEGTLTGKCNLALMIFNPVRTKGYALRSHYEDADKWVTMRWNAEESEIVSPESIANKLKLGRDSFAYRVGVLGLPPLVDANTLIIPDWVQDAIERDYSNDGEYPVILGCDIGGGGDKSVVCVRQGGKILGLHYNSSKDTSVVTDWIHGLANGENADVIVVDNIGIGAGVFFELNKRRLTVRKGDSRATAKDDSRFYNARAEVYWKMRERFEQGTISIPRNQDLIDELQGIGYDPAAGCKIEGKEQLRRKMGKSPDSVDALALTFYVNDDFYRKGKRHAGQKIDFTRCFMR